MSSRDLGCEENLFFQHWNSRTHPPINLANQVKVRHALDQSCSVQSCGPERAHQNNAQSWRSSRTDRRLSCRSCLFIESYEVSNDAVMNRLQKDTFGRDFNLKSAPWYRLEGFGKHCLAHTAPSLWNTLPISTKCAKSIAIFKKSLKAQLLKFDNAAWHFIMYCEFFVKC